MASYDALATTTLDAAQRQLLYIVTNVDDVPSYALHNQEYSPLDDQQERGFALHDQLAGLAEL